ncbi:peptidase S24-like protein [Bifidobacterium margollesii]|uniref:Peptidase S24-like protein n=2 Tax=Bifidobacterium margollesii TaxID=2020964 RepID=A0A2N5JB22_9BIFI|nr:peptidase S24-like protein [Bifidobacterium margollesii]
MPYGEATWSADIEHVLDIEGMFVSTTAGVSMKPMLRNRRDTIVVRPASSVRPDGLRRYDVPLYRRASDGAYVLHRVVGIRRSSGCDGAKGCRSDADEGRTDEGRTDADGGHIPEDTVYVIRGDNTYSPEFIRPDQIIGVLVECYRGDRRIDLDGWPYRAYVRLWVTSYPLRHLCHALRRMLAGTPLGTWWRMIRR